MFTISANDWQRACWERKEDKADMFRLQNNTRSRIRWVISLFKMFAHLDIDIKNTDEGKSDAGFFGEQRCTAECHLHKT